MNPRSVNAALLAFALIAIPMALPLDLRVTGARHAAAAVDGSASIAAPMTITLYSDAMAWRTEPWVFVNAIVTHTEGLRDDGRGTEIGRDGRGSGRAGGDGRVDVHLYDGTGRRFLPFDVVSIVTGTFVIPRIGGPITFTVPELRVDVAPDGTAVEGRAAPGARVAIDLEAPPSSAPSSSAAAMATTVIAGPDGRFRWPIADGARIAPGQGGWATVVDGDGNAFRARFAAFALRLKLAAASADGWLTPADDLAIFYRRRRGDGRGYFSYLVRGQSAAMDGRRLVADSASSVADGGTPFTVTIDSPVLGERTRTGLLPALTIDNAASTLVEGTAPPGASLSVDVFAADAGTAASIDRTAPPIGRRTIVAGPDGRWHADLPAATPLLAGGRVEAALDLGGGLEAAAVALRPRFTVAVDGARMAADVPSGGSYRFTVRAPGGALIGRTRGLTADADGRMMVDLGPNGPWWESDPQLPSGALSTLLPGGSLEVDDDAGGDPLVIAIPRLSAAADVDADAFAGAAPPGTALDVEVIGAFAARRFAVQSDAAGRWSLPLAGRLDVGVGVGARVWATDAAGQRFYVDSAPVRIVAQPDSNHLDAGPWAGRPLRAEIHDAGGRLVGRVMMPAEEGPDEVDRSAALTTTIGGWLVDRLGQEPPMKAGDTVRVRVGDDVAEWVLPPIEARIHPDLDVVAGRTLPGTRLEVIAGELDDPLSVTATVTADAAGVFRADLSGRADVTLGGGVFIRGAFGPHTLLRFVDAPAMSLYVDRAQVTGVLEPNVDVDVRLLDGDIVRASARARTSVRGSFSADLRDAAGAAVIARTGMRLVVDAPDAQLYGHMELDVPPLTIEVGADGRSVGGERPAAGYFDFGGSAAHYGWPIAGSDRSLPMTGVPTESGRWLSKLSRGIQPGDRFDVTTYLASGHVVHRSLTIPILAVEQGGGQVCGFGQPHARSRLRLVGPDGAEHATLDATADVGGEVASSWRAPDGGAVVSRAGERVVGAVGAAAIDIALDVLTATLDLPAGKLFGQIRPGARPMLTSPARDCMFRLTAEDERWLRANHLDPTLETYFYDRPNLPPDGRIDLDLPSAPYAERGFDLHVNSSGGHRIYRPIYHALTLEADVATGRIAGRTRPHADVRLVVAAADGVVRGVFAARADEAGAFDVAAADADGRPIALHPGDRVTAVSSLAAGVDDIGGIGFESTAMTVADLDVDPSAAAIVGRAPAGSTVGLSLIVAGVGPRWIALEAGTDGRWRFGADEVPPRSGWTMDAVIGGRAELAQPDGHRTVASWSGAAREAPPLYLPWGVTGR